MVQWVNSQPPPEDTLIAEESAQADLVAALLSDPRLELDPRLESDPRLDPLVDPLDSLVNPRINPRVNPLLDARLANAVRLANKPSYDYDPYSKSIFTQKKARENLNSISKF